MTPDLRTTSANTPYRKPLPVWLKYAYLLGVLLLLGSGAYYAYELKHAGEVTVSAEHKAAARAAAQELIARCDREYRVQESAQIVTSSRNAWIASAYPSAHFQALAILSVYDVENLLYKSEIDAQRASKSQDSGKMKPKNKKPLPDIILKKLTFDAKYESGSPEIRIELAHNCESRQIISLLSNAITKYTPGGWICVSRTPLDVGTTITMTAVMRKDAP